MEKFIPNPNGRPAAKGLFKQNNPDGIYCLDEFRATFVKIADTTEYKAAIALVGSWAEWERIKANYTEFNVFIQEWIREVEVKQTSDALSKIKKVAHSNDKASFQAAKFLATQEYKRRHTTGRPSKAEKDRELKQIASAAAETAQDKERILTILQGGMK